MFPLSSFSHLLLPLLFNLFPSTTALPTTSPLPREDSSPAFLTLTGLNNRFCQAPPEPVGPRHTLLRYGLSGCIPFSVSFPGLYGMVYFGAGTGSILTLMLYEEEDCKGEPAESLMRPLTGVKDSYSATCFGGWEFECKGGEECHGFLRGGSERKGWGLWEVDKGRLE